jgi:hypothetical protein
MGWYTNYEVEFDESIIWDDDMVEMALPYTTKYIYLRELEKPRAIFCMYSHCSIDDVLAMLKSFYPVGIRYRIYNTNDAWIPFH